MVKQKNDRLPPLDHAGGQDHPSGTRRRGEVLEKAILRAAWDELTEVGYAHLTMEKVAARAKTNKVALYRRWPSKAKLVIAAAHKHLPIPAVIVPNTGNLRDDILFLLRAIAGPLQTIGAETIHGLMVEYLGKELFSSIPQIMRREKTGIFGTTMLTILKNAEKRGEVNLEKIKPRVLSLPADLVRYELLTTHEPLSDATIIEIVDDIFLPLVRSCR